MYPATPLSTEATEPLPRATPSATVTFVLLPSATAPLTESPSVNLPKASLVPPNTTLFPKTNTFSDVFPIALLLPTEYELAAFMILGSPNAPEFSPVTMLPVPIEIAFLAVACAPVPMAIVFSAPSFTSVPMPIEFFKLSDKFLLSLSLLNPIIILFSALAVSVPAKL
ncbi:Uncharacterised protein [Campylobacter geochelonis]|nr:Uncharacterised protein [Campylobacter geochelonis]